MRFTILLVTLTYVTSRRGVLSAFNAGPYNWKLTRHDLCPDQGTGEATRELTIYPKPGGKSSLQGSPIAPFDFGHNVHLELNITKADSQRSGDKTIRMRFKNFCSEFRLMSPTLFNFIFRSWDIRRPSCPIKAGNYNMDMDTDLPHLPNFPILSYGNYKIYQALTYGYPPVRMVCNMLYVTVYDRRRIRGTESTIPE